MYSVGGIWWFAYGAPTPVRKLYLPVRIVARVGEQTGLDQTRLNLTPRAAILLITGVGGVIDPMPYKSWESTPKSSAMISNMLFWANTGLDNRATQIRMRSFFLPRVSAFSILRPHPTFLLLEIMILPLLTKILSCDKSIQQSVSVETLVGSELGHARPAQLACIRPLPLSSNVENQSSACYCAIRNM